MSQLPRLRSLPIAPLFNQSSANEPIQLGQIQVRFEHDQQQYSKAANGILRFLPKDRLSFVIPSEPESPTFGLELALDGWQGELHIGTQGAAVQAMCGAVGTKHGGVNFLPLVSSVRISEPCENIRRATFHLFNFPDVQGPDGFVFLSGTPPTESATLCSRLQLNAAGWLVTITSLPQTGKAIADLKQQGGFVITHVGSIAREDGANFSSIDFEKFLACLQYFLSFAIGRWAGLALPVGYDSQEKKVFEEWGIRRCQDGAWHGSCTWFDRLSASILPEVFPGFVKLWNLPLWHQPLTESIYWYLAANDREGSLGIDAALILAQTALELLAWNYCVRDLKMVSELAFRPQKLSAADKLRLLATAVGIPKEIPAQMKSLRNRPGTKWSDGMHAITDIRNSLVHPSSSSRPQDNTYYDAWRLSLWYIELTLLRLCGHSGMYSNRLTRRTAGTVERVPWAC